MDKLVSSYGHCEVGIDGTAMYQELVDLVFRHETLPQFCRNVWSGIPTLEIVIDEDSGIQTLPTDDEVSVSELLQSFSIEEQVDIIQRALESGDAAVLRAIPVKRQSVWPQMASFVLSMGYQLDVDEHNTLVLGGTQFASDLQSGSAPFHRLNAEWHHQLSRLTKIVTSGTVGTGTLSSQCSVHRTLDARTTLELHFHFNFMDSVWSQFADLVAGKEGDDRIENAADLLLPQSSGSSYGDRMVPDGAWFGPLHEITSALHSGCGSVWFWTLNMVKALSRRSVGALFDVSIGFRRVLSTEWMATSVLRIGRSPSMRCTVAKSGGSGSSWNLEAELGGAALSASVKRESEWEDTLLFYHSMGFDARNLLKFECGFTKRFVDVDEGGAAEQNELNQLEMRGSFGLCLSLSEGLSVRCGVQRGPSRFALPIKLTQSTPSMKPLLLSLAAAAMGYQGYRRFFRPYSMKRRHDKIRERLNERGRRMLNQRHFALKQQAIMRRQSDRNRESQEKDDGLVILVAFYGVDAEAKLVDAVREELDVEGEHRERHGDGDGDGDENEDEEKAVNEAATENGAPPPLWIDEAAAKRVKERAKVDDDRKFRVDLDDVDWRSMEQRLESAMMNDERMDIELPSFLNVRVVLQYMMDPQTSTLTLSSGPKAELPGFSECCSDGLGHKELTLIYRHGAHCKIVTVSDVMPLTVPSDSDRQWIDCRHRAH